MVREGENVTIFFHNSVFGERKYEAHRFKISEVKPYAQYEKTITISFKEPRERQWQYATITPDGLRYITIEDRGGQEIYDSRADVPCDMVKWREARERFSPA